MSGHAARMTTDTTTPAPPVRRRGELSRWFPRSGGAWALLGLGVVATWPPAALVAASAYLDYPACFDSCGDPGESVARFGVAGLFALTPLVALRIHQGEQSAPPAGRVLAAAGLVGFVTALAWSLALAGW
jgi:hypothetical protein